jgi:tetratricopeptide (TPR) repeat protein
MSCTALVVALSLALAPSTFGHGSLALLGSPGKAARTAAQAEALWKDGHYEEASTLLGRAYELDPKPEYLYARASVEIDAKRCHKVVEYFEAYLATKPPEQDAQAARGKMKPCQVELEAKELAAKTAEAEAAEGERRRAEEARLAEIAQREAAIAEAEKRQKEEEKRRRGTLKPPRKDVLAGILVGIGSGAAASGVGLVVAGVVTHGNAGDAPTAEMFVEREDKGRLLTGVGIGVLAGGVALVVGGVVRYGLLAGKYRKARADTAWAPRWRGTTMAVHF